MEGRTSVIVLNDAVINNNNENEEMKRNQEALGLDDSIPRKKFKSKVVKRKEAVKNAKKEVSKKKATAKKVKNKNVAPQGFHKNIVHKNIVHKNIAHKNIELKNKNMKAKKDIHKQDLPNDANKNLSVSISSTEVTIDGIENEEVFINEDEESESSSKKRKRTSKMEKKEEKEKENEDRRKQYEVALQDYHSNPGMSFYGCAKKHKVNKTSLIKYFKFGESFKGRGKSLTVLNKDEEKKICEHIIQLLKLGYSLTFFELRNLIQEALIKLCQANSDRTSPWEEVNHFPEGNFVYSFAARNDLVLRSTMELSKARSMLSIEGLMSWFKDTAEALVNHPDYADCWKDARRVLNQDECGIQIGDSKVKVLAQKGATDVLYSKGGGSHEHVSLSVTANAAGECVGARVIYKGRVFCYHFKS